MGLESVIRHTQRQRDLRAQDLAELQERLAKAEQAVLSADHEVTDAEAAFQIHQSQVTTAGELRQRYTTLSQRRRAARDAREQLHDITQDVAAALEELVAARQQLRAYERLVERRAET